MKYRVLGRDLLRVKSLVWWVVIGDGGYIKYDPPSRPRTLSKVRCGWGWVDGWVVVVKWHFRILLWTKLWNQDLKLGPS